MRMNMEMSPPHAAPLKSCAALESSEHGSTPRPKPFAVATGLLVAPHCIDGFECDKSFRSNCQMAADVLRFHFVAASARDDLAARQHDEMVGQAAREIVILL